ncbi:DUF1516 family protein [Bacillaceae bacterium S4-13-58]
MIEGMIHSHVGGWSLAIVLILLAVIFLKTGQKKVSKILHMILRLVYVIIIISGGYLYSLYFQGAGNLGEATVKALAGLWVIFSMEMILVKMGKDKPTLSYWIQLIIALAITLVLGFGRLELGFLP